MIKLFIAICMIFICLVVTINAGRKPIGRIVDGDIGNITNIPYIVSISQRKGGQNKHNCGGSIIAPRWIVTAAHCETRIEGAIVRAGSSVWASGGLAVKILQVITHEKYDPFTWNHDIALIQTDQDITAENGGKIIKMAATGQLFETGKTLRVSGWGVTKYRNPEPSDVLLTVTVKLIAHEICKRKYQTIKHNITENMICASDKGKDSCTSDSGGPLVVDENLLIGVVSHGFKCATAYPGVYVNLSNYRNWIKEKTGV